MYSVAKSTVTATIDTSPVTAVRLENEYSVGAPSSRNASNHPFIATEGIGYYLIDAMLNVIS